MSTEAIGAYSPTTVYGQLTSPFTPKQITINSHTPYDKVEENESKVYSRSYFKAKPQAKIIYDFSVDESNRPKITNKDEKSETEDKPIDVTPFQVSKMSSKDIVTSSLKHGYTAEQAVVVQKAQYAYKNSAIVTKNPTEVLSNHSYQVV